jgi:hypothetical protein
LRRPVTFNLNIDPAELDETQAAALEKALTYGTVAEIPVHDVRTDLPAGLGGDHETAKVWMGPSVAAHASTDPYVLRLVVNSPDGMALADAPFSMNAVTQGARGGLRATGTAVGGGLDVEMLINPTPKTGEGTFSVKLNAQDFTGLAPAALQRTTRFLASFVAPNRLNIAGEFGPL